MTDSTDRYAPALDVTPAWAKAAGYTFTRKLCGTSYPKNGNAHRPTPEYYWSATYRGTNIGTWDKARKLADDVREYIRTGTDPRI